MQGDFVQGILYLGDFVGGGGCPEGFCPRTFLFIMQ